MQGCVRCACVLHAVCAAEGCELRGQVLRDPRQKRFFKARDIHDLFTLGSQVCTLGEAVAVLKPQPPFPEPMPSLCSRTRMCVARCLACCWPVFRTCFPQSLQQCVLAIGSPWL